MSFEEWMHKVDIRVQALACVSVHDLADQCFYDWFDSGITPLTAARLVLESEGF